MATQIEDFGEKIGGARKDVWVKRFLDSAPLQPIEIVNMPLAKAWPAPDWDKLIENGVEPWRVGIIRAYRDSIPPRPRANARNFKRNITLYAMSVEKGLELTRDLLTGKIDRDVVMDILPDNLYFRARVYEKAGHAVDITNVSLRKREFASTLQCQIFLDAPYSDWKTHPLKALFSPDPDGYIRNGLGYANGSIHDRNVRDALVDLFCERLAPLREQLLQQAKEKAENPTAENASQQTRTDYQRLKKFQITIPNIFGQESGFFITEKTSLDVFLPLSQRFATAREAGNWARENVDEIEKRAEMLKETVAMQNPESQPRVGNHWRNPQRNVTPELFEQTFGFRGVEFGNWVNQAERHNALNRTYDALLDMASVMGLRAKDISLNGELAISFGSRGAGGRSGSIAAYYPSYRVMNFTKNKGAGAVAHEWFHAVDHWQSSQVGFTHQMTSSMVGAHDMRAQLPESVRAAFAEVTHLMRGAFLTRSSQLDARQGRKKPYYSTIIEQTARAFESVVAHRLEQRGWRNEFLVNFTDPEVWRLAQDTVLKNWLDAETLNCMEHPSSYPYLLPNEIPEVDIAYEKLMQVVLDADHNRESDFQVWQPSQEDSDDDYEYEYEDRPFVDYSYARQGSLF